MDPRTTVRAHPVAHRPRRTPVAGVPTAVCEDRVCPLPHAKTALPSGTRIGRYVVHRAIGRGGMGVVYGAVDPQLGRRVALKLVRHDGQPSQRFQARLRREAVALARLNHPNIVSIFDYGSATFGTYVAMEYVRGINLRRWLRLQPRSVEEILSVFRTAGEGLAAAHEAGLVHRDFKPSNVMVTTDRRVKVLDFGLARGEPSDDPWLANTDESLLARRMTRADTVVGTTGYMPPEQLLGADVSPASDQFAFCVALFEALHGVRPFPGKTPVEQARTYASRCRNEVTPRRDLPARVLAAIERGMSLTAEDRFKSVRALLAELHLPPPRPRRTRAALGAALLVATAVASSALTQWLQPTVASDACVTESDVATAGVSHR